MATTVTKTKPRKIWNFDLGDKIREEELDGRHYIVVPMTMILEGVHTGSQGPVYYSVEELAKTPKMWNMKPILIEHPFRGDTATDLEVYKKQAVGMIMGTYFDSDEGKLKAEAWIDKDLAQNKYPSLLEHIEYRLPMEVSTGLFSELILEPGVWKGEEYKGRIVNIRADHLAILPHKQGACSLADGAGLLINQAFDDTPITNGNEQLFVFTTVINGEYPPGTPIIEGQDRAVGSSYEEKKPRPKNQAEEVAPMMRPIQGTSHPYEMETDQFKIIVIPKANNAPVDTPNIPQMSLANYSEEDEEDTPLPDKREEAIQDNAKILSPQEEKKEASEKAETGDKDIYMTLRGRKLRNHLAAALIRRHLKNKKSSKKKLPVRRAHEIVKNEAEYPSFMLGDDAYAWEDRPSDTTFRAQQLFYDYLVAAPRLERFIEDRKDRELIVRELTAILLNTFHVSNINKVQGLMDFAKQETNPVFEPEDISLVEHTIGELETAKEDLSKIQLAEHQYRTEVSATSERDDKYNTLSSFLTGKMKDVFSKINTSASRYSDFEDVCQKQAAGNIKDTTDDRIASKLSFSENDSPDVFREKVNLGRAAIILGEYSEKGVKSDIHPWLLIGDSRDADMKEVLKNIYKRLSAVLMKPTPSTSTHSEQCNECYKIAQELAASTDDTFIRSTGKGKDKKKSPLDTLRDNLLVIAGVKGTRRKKTQDTVEGTTGTSKNGGKTKKGAKTHWVMRSGRWILESINKGSQIPHGMIQEYSRQYTVDEKLIKLYVEQLITMIITRLQYDTALEKARVNYDNALANIDSLGLSDEAKEEFVNLPKQLFDTERQRYVAAATKNTDRLRKFLYRHQKSRLFGAGASGLDAPLSREMLEAIGLIPNKIYDDNDAWLTQERPAETGAGSSRLVDLVSSLPDVRGRARELLASDPDLIRSILGDYDIGDNEEDKKKLAGFLVSDDFQTRDELLSKYDPNFTQKNEEVLRYAKALQDYDPEVGFTDAHQSLFSEISPNLVKDWIKHNKDSNGWKDFVTANPDKATWSRLFKPAKELIPSLLNYINTKLSEKNLVVRDANDTDVTFADRLYSRYSNLDPKIVQELIDSPELSRSIDPKAFGPRKYNGSIRRWLDPAEFEKAKIDNPVMTDLTLIYKAFEMQNIPTKARVLLDHFVKSGGGPVAGEVPVLNQLQKSLKRVAGIINSMKSQSLRRSK